MLIVYDPGIGRFTGVDPISDQFPNVSTYNYAENSPIANIDLWGLQAISIHSLSFAPFDKFGGPFRGDGANSKFSTNANSSFRIAGRVDINATSNSILMTGSHPRGSDSHNTLTGCSTFSEADISTGFTETTVGDGSSSASFGFHLAGNNDLVPGSPDIDVLGNFSVTRTETEGGSTISLSGEITGNGFPANSTFLTDSGGNSVMLGASGAKGNPFTSLFGKGSDKMSEFNLSIKFGDNGLIQGVNLNGQNFSLEEWNKRFTNLNPQDGSVRTNN